MLCTIVAWRVAFLFSSIDVGEHVCVCVCVREREWVCVRVYLSPLPLPSMIKTNIEKKSNRKKNLFVSRLGMLSSKQSLFFFFKIRSLIGIRCVKNVKMKPVGSFSWRQTETGTELCALYPSVKKNFILKKREGKYIAVSCYQKIRTFLLS